MIAAAVITVVLVAAWLVRVPLARALIAWKLGPYRVTITAPDPAKPLTLAEPRARRVAVIGGGLAGISAATTLGARGYAVTLYEANPYLGGKVGSWPVELGGSHGTEQVSHGYHAFFRHYYNLNRFRDALGVRTRFTPISDYRILLPGGGEISFDGRETTPVLNLLAMAKQGLYRFGDVLKAPTRDAMGVFLEYDPKTTPERLDHLSLAEFDRRARLPPRLKMAFNTFARAFFANEEKLSMAELVKGFHSYYLGHAGGLVYDHPTEDYEAAFLRTIRERLGQLGVDLRLGTPVERIEPGFGIGAEKYDHVVLATDVVGTRRILEKSLGLGAGLDPRLGALQPGERYAVLRLWLDKELRRALPVFVITERHALLDAISFVDRAEKESHAWALKHGGSVVELHCYAVPDSWREEDLEAALIDELKKFVPELEGAVVRHSHFQLRRDFAAFHVGMANARPGTDTGVDGLYVAGDWVKLPFPAMLMEAAFSSGLVAANRILARDGLREELVESVPLKGLLAGVPQSPATKKLIA